MKKYKKLLAVLLALTLAFGSSITTFAEEIDLTVETESNESEESFETEETQITEDSDADQILEDEEEIDIDVLEEEETEAKDNFEIDTEDAEKEFPGVDIAGFCSDPEIIEDKETLAEDIGEIRNCVSGEDYIEGEIIVAAPDEETAEIYAEGFGGKLASYLDGFCLIRFDAEDTDEDGYCLTVADAVAASADPNVALPAAYPNYIGDWADYSEWSSIYSDPYLKGTSSCFQYQHSLLQSEAAWRAGYTGSGIKVAVLDSGVREGHKDIPTLYGRGKYNGTTFAATSTALTDEVGHGTHCCGIVAAKTNDIGGCGIAPGAKLYAGKVDVNGSPNDWGLYYAIKYATTTWKVDIISISIAMSGPSPDLEDAVKKAYDAGVAVFVASGNNSTNRLDYPAKCTKAIPVGAVDAGNTKVYFSNQTSKVRYSGPGYGIWSTYNESDTSYTSLDGTSMACPAVAAAAAVILSSDKVTGKNKVEKLNNLLNLMDKGATKSGIGKGTPNIAKSLGLSNYSVAVDAPYSLTPSGTMIYDSVETISLRSAKGTSIYYNINGENITYKNGIVSNYTGVAKADEEDTTPTTASITLYAKDGGKRVIKAVAIDESTQLCSKVASFTYTFKQVAKITITSKNLDFFVIKGSSLQLGATVLPSTAANKTLTWSLASNVTGVSINPKNGKLTVDKKATASSVTVKATANDGSGIYVQKAISIKSGNQVKSVSLDKKSITLYEGETATIKATTVSSTGSPIPTQSNCIVTSSNTNVATATLSNNTITITGKMTPGKVTVTCYSNDGNYKKAAVTVTVLKAVSGVIDVYKPSSIVQGGSFSQKVTVSPSNASNKKLIWSLSLQNVPAHTDLKTCGVSINAGNGQVKVSSKAVIGSYKVKYQAADNKGYSDTFIFSVVAATTKISKLSIKNNNLTLFRKSNGKGAAISSTVPVTATTIEGSSSSNFRISENSAPGLVSATISSGTVKVSATGYGTGNANITVSTTDGTNLKQVIKVKVVNPPSNLMISLPADRTEYLGYGKSMKLVPTFYTDYGPLDAGSKKINWTSNYPSVVNVSSNGTVKTVSNRVGPFDNPWPVTITATAADNSGVKATITIYPEQTVGKIVDKKTISVPNTLGEQYLTQLEYYYVIKEGYHGIYWPVSYTVSGPEGGCIVQAAAVDSLWSSYYYNVLLTKKGSYTVTYRINDGSNKKVTVRYNCKKNY